MAKYTLELREIVENDGQVFDFDYPFFEPYQKEIFEDKFINHYYYNEICCETIPRWKHMLQSELKMLFTKYEQLYYTVKESQKISFMLNKDLKETWIREIKRTGKEITIQNNTSEGDTQNSGALGSKEEYKASNLDSGLASVNTDTLTEISNTVNNATSNSVVVNRNNGTIEENVNNEGDEKESYELLSQGNIGTTSSAQLLRDWRSVLVDLQSMLIEDLKCLFMTVY